MRSVVLIEKGPNNYSAYVPDLPGCVSTGGTLAEVKAEIRDAIAFHLDGMREDGETAPPPSSRTAYADLSQRSVLARIRTAPKAAAGAARRRTHAKG